jgi:DNA-binding transcriptional MocR family regulator
MSHKATNWLASLTPTEMTHGEFRVLFHLCDCHNPSQGCFPSQSYLRDHTGLSNGGLNKALGNLEDKGLIRREQRNNPKNRQRLPSLYILGFEMKAPQGPTPLRWRGGQLHLSGGAISTFRGGPSPLRWS